MRAPKTSRNGRAVLKTVRPPQIVQKADAPPSLRRFQLDLLIFLPDFARFVLDLRRSVRLLSDFPGSSSLQGKKSRLPSAPIAILRMARSRGARKAGSSGGGGRRRGERGAYRDVMESISEGDSFEDKNYSGGEGSDEEVEVEVSRGGRGRDRRVAPPQAWPWPEDRDPEIPDRLLYMPAFHLSNFGRLVLVHRLYLRLSNKVKALVDQTSFDRFMSIVPMTMDNGYFWAMSERHRPETYTIHLPCGI